MNKIPNQSKFCRAQGNDCPCLDLAANYCRFYCVVIEWDYGRRRLSQCMEERPTIVRIPSTEESQQNALGKFEVLDEGDQRTYLKRLRHAVNYDYKDDLPLYPGKIIFQSNEAVTTPNSSLVWDAHDEFGQKLLPTLCIKCGTIHPTRQRSIDCECE